MLQQRLYIPFKWDLFLSFADVMCFFISVYLLIRVSEKCQIYSFCFSKEEKSRTFIAMVYHLIFLFSSSRLLNPILSFQKFASITESFILCLLGVILGFILSYCHSIRWKMENVKISPCFMWDYVKYRIKINGIMWNIYVFMARIMWKVLSLQL